MPNILTSEERKAIRERCANATPGPWDKEMLYIPTDEDGDPLPPVELSNGVGVRAVAIASNNGELVAAVGVVDVDSGTLIDSEELAMSNATANAPFIAHARADLPAALDTIEALEGVVREALSECEKFINTADEQIAKTKGDVQWGHRRVRFAAASVRDTILANHIVTALIGGEE
jgi:hypothetical protein